MGPNCLQRLSADDTGKQRDNLLCDINKEADRTIIL